MRLLLFKIQNFTAAFILYYLQSLTSLKLGCQLIIGEILANRSSYTDFKNDCKA